MVIVTEKRTWLAMFQTIRNFVDLKERFVQLKELPVWPGDGKGSWEQQASGFEDSIMGGPDGFAPTPACKCILQRSVVSAEHVLHSNYQLMVSLFFLKQTRGLQLCVRDGVASSLLPVRMYAHICVCVCVCV